MAFKFVFAFAFIAVASAGYVPATQVYHAAPVAVHAAPVAVAHNVALNSEEHDPHPQYRFSYGVEDKLTGDSKSQVEERDGDVVRGEYSLEDADGYKRTVQYTADAHNGFNAVVHREPLVKSVVPVAVKTVAPVTHYTAPTVVKTVQPVAHYSAPTVTHYYSPATIKNEAPVAHYTAPVAHYSTPVAHYSAPVAHYAAPTHFTTYASPAFSYHH